MIKSKYSTSNFIPVLTMANKIIYSMLPGFVVSNLGVMDFSCSCLWATRWFGALRIVTLVCRQLLSSVHFTNVFSRKLSLFISFFVRISRAAFSKLKLCILSTPSNSAHFIVNRTLYGPRLFFKHFQWVVADRLFLFTSCNQKIFVHVTLSLSTDS